jgi:FkbM family methyltransferase
VVLFATAMRPEIHARLYEVSSRLLLLLLRMPGLSPTLTLFSKVWLRHARLAGHLARGSYDAIVDGGASIGEFAALARLACPCTPLICVEPHPASAARLRQRGFSVVEAALWNERGTATLTQPADAVTSCSLVATGDPGRPTWSVATVRLDQLSLVGRQVLVKLDLQGAEPQALEGMGALWERCAGLLLEVSYGEQGTYEPLRALLASKGFREAATFNELETENCVVEADKLWVRRDRDPAGARG